MATRRPGKARRIAPGPLYLLTSWPMTPPTAAPPTVPTALPPVRTAPPTAPTPAPTTVFLVLRRHPGTPCHAEQQCCSHCAECKSLFCLHAVTSLSKLLFSGLRACATAADYLPALAFALARQSSLAGAGHGVAFFLRHGVLRVDLVRCRVLAGVGPSRCSPLLRASLEVFLGRSVRVGRLHLRFGVSLGGRLCRFLLPSRTRPSRCRTSRRIFP
jgi:hypothetical protein